MLRSASVALALALLPVSGCKNAENKAAEADDAVRLPEEGKATVKVGQRLRYAAPHHGSVGIDSSVAVEGKAVTFEKSEVVLDAKNPAPGGDAGRKLHTFKATAVGDATIVVTRVYRGKDEEKKTVVVRVE